MRYTPEHKRASRRAILKAAARAFRAQGFERPSVASIMEGAGLTHGAFYAHFGSKDDLVAEVIRGGFDGVSAKFDARLGEARDDDWLRRWVRGYLSDGHRAHPEGGCPLPTLSAEVARTGPETIGAYTEIFRRRVEGLAEHVRAGDREARRRVLSAMATMVGAMALARALDAPESEEVLAAARCVAEGLLVDGVASMAGGA